MREPRGFTPALILASFIPLCWAISPQRPQRRFHKIAMGVKDEAVVLFGPDSDQIAALGMKKKSERSRPKRSAKAAEKG